MKNLKAKFTSRKFLMALAGVIGGAVLIACGSTAEGTTALITSVLGYLVAEGYVDAKAVTDALSKENTYEKH